MFRRFCTAGGRRPGVAFIASVGHPGIAAAKATLAAIFFDPLKTSRDAALPKAAIAKATVRRDRSSEDQKPRNREAAFVGTA